MKLNYIIVDPETKMHDIIEAYCKELDYMNMIAHCYTANECYEIVQRERIDIIFLDINLNHLDAFKFLKSLKESTKIIVVTANIKDSLQAYEIDISEFLLKPFTMEKFVNCLQRIQNTLPQVLSNLKNKN